MRSTSNMVTIQGYVFSHHLFERVTGPTTKNPGQPFINGSIDIAIDEAATQTVHVQFSYVTPTYKNGNENLTYSLLKKIIDTNDVYERVGNHAIKVRLDANFGTNVYKNRTGDIVVSTRIDGAFMHELEPAAKFGTIPAKFSVDMVITNTAEREFANGSTLFELHGYVFNYRQSLVPITFTVDGEEGQRYFESQDYPMFTNLWGNIESETIVSQRELTASAFGNPQVETTERQVMRWNVKGSANEPYEYDDPTGITKEEMKEKLAEHEAYIAQQTARLNGAGTAAPAAYSVPKKKAAAAPKKAPAAIDEFDF